MCVCVCACARARAGMGTIIVVTNSSAPYIRKCPGLPSLRLYRIDAINGQVESTYLTNTYESKNGSNQFIVP